MQESSTLELKEKLTNTFLKTVSAYANYGTGQIVFGIDNAGKVVGLSNLEEDALRIEHKINDSIYPIPLFSLEKDENYQTITLTVYKGINTPYEYKDKAYKRSDTSTTPVDMLEYRRLVQEGKNISFDQLASTEKNFSFSKLQTSLQKSLEIKHVNKDVLKSLGLIDMQGRYTNAAALFSDINQFAGVDLVRFGENANEIYERNTVENVSILEQYDKSYAMCERYYSLERIQSKARKRVEEVPSEAFREAIANALVHRTWDVPTNITVFMYQNRIEITSPGGLPANLTEAEFFSANVSVVRNQLLAPVFLRLGLIEKLGTGIKRIFSAYEGSGIAPVFAIYPNSVSVTLPVIGDTQPLLPSEKTILDVLKVDQLLSTSEIAGATGMSKDKVVRTLKQLLGKGLAQRFGEGRATRYVRSR